MNLGGDIEMTAGRVLMTTIASENENDSASSRSRRSRASSNRDGVHLPAEYDSHSIQSRPSRRRSSSEHRTRSSGETSPRCESITTRSCRSSRASSASPPFVKLNQDFPGDWIISHHLNGLITRLMPHRVGYTQSIIDGLKKKFQEIKEGKPVSETLSPDPIDDGKRFRIDFAEVQRMRIRKLQCQLVRHVIKMRLSGHESPGWEETLETYITALKDHDYMEKRRNPTRDPFSATGECLVDNYVLNCNIDTELANKPDILFDDSSRPWDYGDPVSRMQDHSICGTRSNNIATTWRRGFEARLVLAAVGGAFLIGPMWMMVLHTGKYFSLIATTALVSGFGILMAYFLDEGKDVLASTAAYAAVLVVFIGTST